MNNLKTIFIFVTSVVIGLCLEPEALYSGEEITWLEDPKNYTLLVDFQNATISLCKVNDVCRNVISSSTDFYTSHWMTLLTQKGVDIQLSTHPVNMTQFHRVSKDSFQSCRLQDANNDTSLVFNASSEDFTIPEDILIPGENLLMCDGYQNSGNDTCPVWCRLNITVKGNPCSDEFARNLCFDNGNCTAHTIEAGFTCKCNNGYSGNNCETRQEEMLPESECLTKNCLNGGTCVPILSPTNSSERTKCECPLHVSGELCETVLNSCTSSPCVNGVCVEKEGGYQCFCVPGFHGNLCEFEYNECLSNPCSNHGTCIDRIDRFECRCVPGYNGVNCEHKINYCESSPCKHNATCASLDDRFQCKCTHGHTGPLCEHKIRECSSSPCKNHGTCIEFNRGYKCLCPVTFAGLHCEYMMDVFAPPMEGTGLSSDAHKHNLYIVAATLGSMILIIVSVIIACYCKIYETYKQVMWKRLRYHRKRSNSCPDMESCTESANVNKHRLSADAIWEATSLCHDNAAFEQHGNHQTFNNLQI